MKKKGFTLVELLAVIAILAILILVAMPSVIALYNKAREKSFRNEVETVKVELEKEKFNSSLNGVKIPEVYSSFGENQLDMDGRELEYYAEMNSDGSIKYLEVSDGQFYYQCKENAECNSVSLKEEDPFIKMDYIKENMATEKVFVYDTLYNISDSSNSIPVIMTNVSEFDIKVNVSYGENISKSYTIPKNTIDHMVFMKFDENTFKSLHMNTVESFKIETETIIGKDLENEDIVVKFPYSNKVKFQKIDTEMLISDVIASKNNDKIGYNQSGVYIPANLDIGSLSFKIKNQTNKTFKFANIYRDELIEDVEGKINEKSYKPVRLEKTDPEYKEYENYLMQGVYFSNYSDRNFDMMFGESDKIQRIYFDFNVFINPGVYQSGNITISTKENSDENNYGAFKPFPVNGQQQHGKNFCNPLSICFGNMKYDYENNALVLGQNYETGVLTIDQSMGVRDTYSVYMTIKPDTLNQVGKPAGSFPGTILAISEANTKYLSWIGIYDGYLQVYSYYNGTALSGQKGDYKTTGFRSFDIKAYEGKIMNIMVTAERGGDGRSGKTNVYINGKKAVDTFNSGANIVTYTGASIGDLRQGRGLKYSGLIYDLALYNTVLSEEAISHNWNYANKTWNIEK